MKFIIFISVIIFYCFSFQNSIQAQGRGEDPTFITGTGFNGLVTQIVLQPDEKILVRGNFTEYNGTPANRIIRLNTDGSRDESFQIGTGFNNTVYKIVLQSDGKIVLGGDFTEYNGVSANRIIRLNADGSRDGSFQIGTGFDRVITDIALQSDNKIILAGGGGKYKGDTCSYPVARLHINGDIDTTFKATKPSNILVNSQYSADMIAVQPTGKIIVKGEFYTKSDIFTIRVYLFRLDMNGKYDDSFGVMSIHTGWSEGLETLVTNANGEIFVGGQRIFDINRAGTLAFVSLRGVNGGERKRIEYFTANKISGLTIDDKGNIWAFPRGAYCNGAIELKFGSVNCKGIRYNYIVNFDVNGVLKTELNAGNLFNNEIRSGVIQSDGKILLGGDFTSYDGFPRNRIIRLIDGFAPLKADEISISPNPTSDYLKLKVNPNSIWQIADTFGKVLMAGKIKEPNTQIDLRGLSHGMYIIHLTDPQGNKATKRIVKQ